MRSRLAVGIATLLMAAAIVWNWPEKSGDHELDEAGSNSNATVARPARASPTSRERPERPQLAMAPTAETRTDEPRLRIVNLSSAEKRPGETDESHRMRTAWLLKLSQFETRAGLTPEEKERVLAALADTQQQAVLSMDLLKDTLRDPSVRVERVDELERSLREGLLKELRSFLDPSQVLEFRRKAGLTRGLALALFEPLDIEYRDP